MLNSFEAALEFDRVLARTKEYMKDEDHVYPVLYAINKERPTGIMDAFEHPNIIVMDSNESQMKPGDTKAQKNMHLLPDTIRLLHCCFYLKDEPAGFARVLPFHNYEPCPVEQRKRPDDNGPFVMPFIEFGWTSDLNTNKPRINDPYPRG